MYQTLHFFRKDGSQNLKTVVQYTSELLNKHGLKNNQEIQHVAGIYIYPSDFFSPKDLITGNLSLTKNSRTIHHYMGSWGTKTKLQKFIRMIKYKYIIPLLPTEIVQKILIYKENKRNKHNY